MDESLTPICVFISSPGDLVPEREVVKQVLDDLNSSPRYKTCYKLIAYADADSTPALVGQSAQQVVDRYLLLPQGANIFVCMLWLRMVTPAKDVINPETNQPYQSGTEYEFLTAYRARQDANTPLMLLYRCLRPPQDIRKLDVVHYGRVGAFFDRFGVDGDLKSLVGEFGNATELKDTLRRDLEQLLEHDIPQQAAKVTAATPTERKPVYFLPDSLPNGYVERTAALDELRKTLVSSRDTVGVVATAAVHGAGRPGQNGAGPCGLR